MIRALVHQGRVEIQEPITEERQGLLVEILPLTPDDPIPDLEERIAALRALGPMEFEPGERELIASFLAEQKRLSLVVSRYQSARSSRLDGETAIPRQFDCGRSQKLCEIWLRAYLDNDSRILQGAAAAG